jgi:hypothetical protein
VAVAAGAVFAVAFHVVLLGQGRNVGGVSAQLPEALQYDLGAAVVSFDLALNFDLLSLQLADVADTLQIARKYDDGERANTEVFSEVEEMYAAVAELHLQNFPCDAAVRANVFLGVCKRNTRRGSGRGEGVRKDQHQENESSTESMHSLGGIPILGGSPANPTSM